MAVARDQAEIELPEEDYEPPPTVAEREAAAQMPPPPARAARATFPDQAAADMELDDDEEPEEENTGQWSPRPLDPEHVAGQDVIPEEEDARLLELLRAQVSHMLQHKPFTFLLQTL